MRQTICLKGNLEGEFLLIWDGSLHLDSLQSWGCSGPILVTVLLPVRGWSGDNPSSWSGACVSLICQTYQRKVFMGFCSCSWGVKVNETPCWWKEVGCAGRTPYPDLGQMWKPQLSTWLVMLGWDFGFLELLQDLLNIPWAEYECESKAGLCLKSQER